MTNERGVILETLLEEQVESMPREGIGGSPIAARPTSRRLDDAVDAAPQVSSFIAQCELVRFLVDVAVMADLVAVIQDEVDGPRIVLDAPARHEEGLTQTMMLEH